MTDYNHKIRCDVSNCCYNHNGVECNKQTITVCYGEANCTCCASYKSIED